MKTETGRLSKEQKDRHARLKKLGFEVYTVQHEHPLDTAEEVGEIIAPMLGEKPAIFRGHMAIATQEVLEAIKGQKR
ncbi:hypothetical protein GQE99_06530 [Maritimibacter sp. DP07]|uniref:Uncharacterized protein n=1 Tax=Maritimibacter harenae TaxID=2606218 RepID=A0A845LY26_9RHOB|nr:hypothetical protein [Maritimibacter harenae]MZR12675.1 hypothetical protein [Maritimibacter harenae]